MRLEGPLQDAFESMLLSTEFRADFQVDLKVLIEIKKLFLVINLRYRTHKTKLLFNSIDI